MSTDAPIPAASAASTLATATNAVPALAAGIDLATQFCLLDKGIKRVKFNYNVLKMVDLYQIEAKTHSTKDGMDDYKKFLSIRGALVISAKMQGYTANYKTHMLISPTDDMDAVWHAHILDTQSYASVCEMIAGVGGFVHHDPNNSKDLFVRTARRALLKLLWKQVWPDAPPKLGWGPDPSECEAYVKRLTGRKRQRVSDKAFQVFVKDLTGKTITLEVDSHTEVEDFKIMINDRSGIPLESMRIIHAGIQLEDGNTLRKYGTQKESTFHVVLRMSGC